MRSKLRELLTAKAAHHQYPATFRGFPDVAIISHPPGEMTPDLRQEHRLELRIFIKFACNNAEYETARDNAESRLQYHLFSTIVPHLQDAMSAIYAGQETEAMAAVERALKECTK